MRFWLIPIKYPGDKFGYAELVVRSETAEAALVKATAWCQEHAGTRLRLEDRPVQEWIEDIYLNQGSDY